MINDMNLYISEKHMPPKSLHRNVTNSNHTKHMVTYNPMLNDSAVVVMSTPSTHTREVERQSLRDSGFTSAYWTFIVVYAIASTSIFLFAFFVLNFFRKFIIKDIEIFYLNLEREILQKDKYFHCELDPISSEKNMSKQFKGKDYYGIQFKPEGQTEEEIQSKADHCSWSSNSVKILFLIKQWV